jgi:hypothetical protein
VEHSSPLLEEAWSALYSPTKLPVSQVDSPVQEPRETNTGTGADLAKELVGVAGGALLCTVIGRFSGALSPLVSAGCIYLVVEALSGKGNPMDGTGGGELHD